MFRYRKLVVALVRYIDITLLDAWWPPFFFWSINSFTDSLLLTEKSERWKLTKKKCFSTTASSKIRPSWPSGVRENEDFLTIFSVKEGFDCHIESSHSVLLPVVERLAFFSKSKWTRRRLQWPAYLRNERGDPQCFLYFIFSFFVFCIFVLHKVPII